VCVCVISFARASVNDDGERYAHRDGQDAYGPRFDARSVPTLITERLTDQGAFTVPSFLNLTVMRDDQECWVMSKFPQAA
jgi:hypothetical protein